MSKQNTNSIRPSSKNPELLEMVTDFATFTKKWNAPKLAKTLGISKQALYTHIDKKKEAHV